MGVTPFAGLEEAVLHLCISFIRALNSPLNSPIKLCAVGSRFLELDAVEITISNRLYGNHVAPATRRGFRDILASLYVLRGNKENS